MPLFEQSVSVNTSAEELFDFLIRPQNVLKINPPEMQMNLINVPEVLENDSKLNVELLGFGIPQRVVQQVTEFTSPSMFTVSQIEGPLSKWSHSHHFDGGAEGNVTLTERIDFEPPGGMIGFVITADKIKEYLEKGFAHRHVALKELFE